MTVMDAIRTRRSVREYDPRPMPDDVLHRVLEALRLAPSACNNQPWKFVVVQDPIMRQEIAKAARDQKFIADAPVIVVGVGLPQQAYKSMGGSRNSAEMDVAIALDHLSLAAVEEGLGTCWIGAFDEPRVKKLLKIPETCLIAAMMPLGYPARPELLHAIEDRRRKKPQEALVFGHYH